jgi:transposase
MMHVAANPRIFLFGDPVDMRKSFEGLSSLAQDAFPGALMEAYFLFLNRSRDRAKILYWDGDGFVLWYKRLEKGTFLCTAQGNVALNRREFFLLLEGITPKKMQRRFSLQKPS